MKYLLPLFCAAVLTTGFVSAAAGQSLDSGSAPDNTDGRSADVLAPRTKSQASTPNPNAKNEPLTAMLAKDEKGKNRATTFAPNDKVYYFWKAPSAVKGEKVRVVWYAAETGKVFPKNKKLSEFTQTIPGPNAYGTSIAPTVAGGLPVGKYRVEIYENAKLAQSEKFTITK